MDNSCTFDIEEHSYQAIEHRANTNANILDGLGPFLPQELDSLLQSNHQAIIQPELPLESDSPEIGSPKFNRMKSHSDKTGDNVRASNFAPVQTSEARNFPKISPKFDFANEPYSIISQGGHGEVKHFPIVQADELGKRDADSYLEVMAQGDSEFDRQIKKLKQPGKFPESSFKILGWY